MDIKLLLSKLNWDISNLPEKSTVTFLNPYSYILLRKNEVIDKIDFIGIDGILLKKILYFLTGTNVPRISFDETSLAPLVYEDCVKYKKNIYFIGSTDHNINSFLNVILLNKPNLNIAGYRNGYFNSMEERNNVIDNIILLDPNFVVVGMGTPFQEEFIVDLKNKGFNGKLFTCGGYLHQTKNRIKYYPSFIHKYNLRWLYRIYDEPKLIKRYFIIYPKAVFYIFNDLLRFKFNNSKDKH
jgi:exopolysaccharide biosynthesis WecB/TagA/CpsF family protein